MIHPYHETLAQVLTQHSTKLKKGENVLIDAFDVPESFVIALVRAVRKAGATPFVQLHSAHITRELALGITKEQAMTMLSIDLPRIKKMQAYIAVRGTSNIAEMNDVPQERMNMS